MEVAICCIGVWPQLPPISIKIVSVSSCMLRYGTDLHLPVVQESWVQDGCHTPVRRIFVLRCFDLGCCGTSWRLWLLLLLDTWSDPGCAPS